jgi:uncharacterized Zn-binding protein involved in type VI secretion
MSAFIVEGDTTDHGGKVLAYSPEHKVGGKHIARLGDMVSCGKCGGVYPIVKVMPRGMSMGGKPPAFEGDQTACGARLIASQSMATAQPTGGSSGSIGQAGPLANHETASNALAPYRGRFQALDETTGQPVPNHPYTIHASDGTVTSGNTDAQGYTPWHEAESPVSLRFSSPSTQVKGGAGDA